MPTAQELKRVREELDAQIVAAKQEEAHERELALEEACKAAEVRAQAEEEAWKQEEERRARKEGPAVTALSAVVVGFHWKSRGGGGNGGEGGGPILGQGEGLGPGEEMTNRF